MNDALSALHLGVIGFHIDPLLILRLIPFELHWKILEVVQDIEQHPRVYDFLAGDRSRLGMTLSLSCDRGHDELSTTCRITRQDEDTKKFCSLDTSLILAFHWRHCHYCRRREKGERAKSFRVVDLIHLINHGLLLYGCPEPRNEKTSSTQGILSTTPQSHTGQTKRSDESKIRMPLWSRGGSGTSDTPRGIRQTSAICSIATQTRGIGRGIEYGGFGSTASSFCELGVRCSLTKVRLTEV